MYKKKILLCTVTGNLFFSCCSVNAGIMVAPTISESSLTVSPPVSKASVDSASAASTSVNPTSTAKTPANLAPKNSNSAVLHVKTRVVEAQNRPDLASPPTPKRDWYDGAKVQIVNQSLTLNNVNIRDMMNAVSATSQNATLNISDGIVNAKLLALSAVDSGHIDASGLTITSTSTGLQTTNGTISLKDSTVTIKGGYDTRGIILQNQNRSLVPRQTPAKNDDNIVKLTNTKIIVEDGVGIYGPLGQDIINLVNSEIRSDVLLTRATDFIIPGHQMPKGTLTLTADNSLLEGGSRIIQNNEAIFNLNNGTKWFLKISKNEMDSDPLKSFEYKLLDIEKRAHSEISVLHLNNSSVIFNEPIDEHYQTLSVGSVQQEARTSIASEVYRAAGGAKIHINAEWSTGASISEQKTDRVIVHGNVSGTTAISIKVANKNKKIASNLTGSNIVIPLNKQGISIIQVSGNADKNSFKLAKSYITIEGSPYQYTLNAYGPGEASSDQTLFGNGENSEENNFWDFRLQHAYLDPEAKVKALSPQMASYLVMPNALFSTGISDVSNQITLLANMHSTSLDINNDKGIFASSYGDKITLSSDRGALKYGYGADISYGAGQAGFAMSALEKQNVTTHFGVLGTYGQLSFNPKDMEGADKSILNKWVFTVAGGMNHDNGLYVDTLFSYGLLQGNIANAIIGNTAKFDNTKTVNVSATIGHKLVIGVKSLVFEPQAQLIYQRLMFDTISDADNFKVDMNNPRQWLVRLGGRITKTVIHSARDKVVSVYGKFNISRTFGDNNTIQAGDTFQLESMGSSIEGGVGVHAHLSQQITINGDVSYQHKLQKSGVSGMKFAGGMSYYF